MPTIWASRSLSIDFPHQNSLRSYRSTEPLLHFDTISGSDIEANFQ